MKKMNNLVVKVDAFKLLVVENLKYRESKSSETFSSNYTYKFFLQEELLAKDIPVSSPHGKEKRLFFSSLLVEHRKLKISN